MSEKRKRRPVITYKTRLILIALAIVAVVATCVVGPILLGYTADWTGFNARSEPNIPSTIFRPAKTLWDWIQLGIPAFVTITAAFGVWWLNRDRMQEDRLQAYLDRMTNLLLEKNLPGLTKWSVESRVAQTLTLTVLRSLDSKRKGEVLRFLYDSRLIDKNNLFHPPSRRPTDYVTSADLHDANPSISVLEFKIDSKPDADLEGEIRKAEQEDFKRNPLISLANADLTNAKLRRSRMTDVDLSDADLSGADLNDATLFGANLSGATLFSANLSGANLCAVFLLGANLSRAKLVDASLAGAFVNAESGAEPYESTEIVRGDTRPTTNLRGANLNGANLSGADLSGKTDLSGANLKGANLEGAMLNGANLSGANLSKARISDEQLAKVGSLKNAIMPDGSYRNY